MSKKITYRTMPDWMTVVDYLAASKFELRRESRRGALFVNRISPETIALVQYDTKIAPSKFLVTFA